MFSQEVNGYNRREVDSYIQRLKVSYESKLMEEKLKTLESEKRVLDLKNEQSEIENKEKNIINALKAFERAKEFEEEGSQTFYNLMMDKLELLLSELTTRFAVLRRDQNFEDILNELTSLLKTYKENQDMSNDITRPILSGNDSMRVLLNKMQDYKKVPQKEKQSIQPAAKASTNTSTNKPKQVRIQLNRGLQDIPPNESGFSFKEALNPTEDLSEIMKAFDFYNQYNQNNSKNGAGSNKQNKQ